MVWCQCGMPAAYTISIVASGKGPGGRFRRLSSTEEKKEDEGDDEEKKGGEVRRRHHSYC